MTPIIQLSVANSSTFTPPAEEIPDPFARLERLGSAAGFLDEVQCVLRTLDLFEGFSRDEYALLCEYMDCFGAPSHTTILHEGEAGDFLIIVLTGSINVVKAFGENELKTLVHLGAGEIVGEMSLVDGQPRFASCITSEPTDFVVLTRPRLAEILVDHPGLGNKLLLTLLQLMTQRLRDTTTRMLPAIAGRSI
jgi:CRP-like cAMP-binding protein